MRKSGSDRMKNRERWRSSDGATARRKDEDVGGVSCCYCDMSDSSQLTATIFT